MGSKSVIFVACLLGALSAVACGTDDDSGSNNNAGNSSSGRGGNGSSGRGNGGGANNAGSAAGGAAGEDGEAGAGGGGDGCTDFSEFVHTVIAEDTNGKSAPRPVNGVDFCTTPVPPGAFDDLF